ncbi:MAG: YbhB/YbcL family Raf kinase inhibitor-like protein [Imperialibacter sp.]|uniref:YbhB/YbcL family Raf kinase inhibitor-like protein n=1 Tax=Imperialibacter sp. TaxID=2038411 RepID=UPI0032EB5937
MLLSEKPTDFKALLVTSSAFDSGGVIPARFTCDGENINPPLHIQEIPWEAKSLVLMVEDPDAPGKTWLHWLVWNIPITHQIEENSVPGMEGTNDFKKSTAYGGPCPPSGTHRYFFKVYALDILPDLVHSPSKIQVEEAMRDHIIAYGELMGTYKRTQP